MTALLLIKQYWKLALIAALVSALGVQTLRMSWKQELVVRLEGELAVFKEREAAQLRAQALRDLHNARNRERADEEYRSSSARAGAVRVRVDAGAAIAAGIPAYAGGGDQPAACVGRGELERWIADVAGRNAGRLTEILRGAAERLGSGATEPARAAESVAAAYRACRGYALGLD